MKRLFVLLVVLMCGIAESQETTENKLVITSMVTPTINEEARKMYNQGTECFQKQDYVNAERYLLKAIEIDPNFIDAIDHLGLLYKRIKKYDNAIDLFKKSIQLNKANIVPYTNLALVYKELKRYEEARQIYIQAYEQDKNEPEIYYGLGQL